MGMSRFISDETLGRWEVCRLSELADHAVVLIHLQRASAMI